MNHTLAITRTRLDEAVAPLLAERAPLVLAVSGGIDSMSLLDVCASAPDRVAPLMVATFDHGTGPAATAASALAENVAQRHGIDTVTGKGDALARDEATWREARWRFLWSVAESRGARVVTAHTRDDQVETVVMRVLRGAGGRGLSALRAPSPVCRPFLDIWRAEIEEYAASRRLAWVDDPSNARPVHLRNRVRRDLLPALRACDPAIDAELLRLSEEAGRLRESCAEIVGRLVVDSRPGRVLAQAVLDDQWGDDAAALFCQTLADFAGLALDWRGTARLADFARAGRVGRMIPLSGGWEAIRRRDALEIRRRAARTPDAAVPLASTVTTFGSWRFHALACDAGDEHQATLHDDASSSSGGDLRRDIWRAWLPSDARLEVRSWRDGDRMISSGSGQRRVKRFLSDGRVVAADRAGWPVVVADGEIVWIPGVRRARAATARPGRPRVCVVCERLYG